ncbi:hypothetical protein RRG08_036086 [Elysia crispata]|uniref:Uncharacterized protein n=1 Tax=Elysia crispata TaxID=231223 RepID=A0AAE1E1W4_9GAST|nr:hypothetical protein RRG08_036086 [Elysia crispata]
MADVMWRQSVQFSANQSTCCGQTSRRQGPGTGPNSTASGQVSPARFTPVGDSTVPGRSAAVSVKAGAILYQKSWLPEENTTISPVKNLSVNSGKNNSVGKDNEIFRLTPFNKGLPLQGDFPTTTSRTSLVKLPIDSRELLKFRAAKSLVTKQTLEQRMVQGVEVIPWSRCGDNRRQTYSYILLRVVHVTCQCQLGDHLLGSLTLTLNKEPLKPGQRTKSRGCSLNAKRWSSYGGASQDAPGLASGLGKHTRPRVELGCLDFPSCCREMAEVAGRLGIRGHRRRRGEKGNR